MADSIGPIVIPDQPMPVISSGQPSTTPITTPTNAPSVDSPVVGPTAMQDQAINQTPTAVDTVGVSLDTKNRMILGTFTFGQVGAIQIGSYVHSVSGQINISPAGIVAENSNGDTTFALDGETGNATFKGTVQAGSLISGSLVLGGSSDGNGTMIIEDASGNHIIVGDHLGHHYYDTSGHELVRVDWTGLTGFDGAGTQILKLTTAALNAYGTNGDILRFFDSASTGTPWAKMGYNLGASGPHSTTLYSVGTIELRTFDDNTYFGAGHAYIIIGSGSPLFEDIFMFSKNNIGISAGGTINVSSPFQINGTTKTAIVPVEDGYRALYTNESPEVWFMDFADNEQAIDPMFLEVTEGEMKIIECKDGSIQVWRHRKGYEKERFTQKTYDEFMRNDEFWSLPHVS